MPAVSEMPSEEPLPEVQQVPAVASAVTAAAVSVIPEAPVAPAPLVAPEPAVTETLAVAEPPATAAPAAALPAEDAVVPVAPPPPQPESLSSPNLKAEQETALSTSRPTSGISPMLLIIALITLACAMYAFSVETTLSADVAVTPMAPPVRAVRVHPILKLFGKGR